VKECSAFNRLKNAEQ
jgi:hypothetical protein